MKGTEQSVRSWGPFTGRQLTVVVVAVVIGLVMVPSTVWAVATFSNVAIEDPSSGVRASVDHTHHLLVGGTVEDRMTSPTTPFSFSQDLFAGQNLAVVGPTTGAIDITALSVSRKDAATGTADVFLSYEFQPSTNTFCVGGVATLFHVPSTPAAAFVESFPTPLVIHPGAGQTACLRIGLGSNTGGTWTVNGSGFLGG